MSHYEACNGAALPLPLPLRYESLFRDAMLHLTYEYNIARMSTKERERFENFHSDGRIILNTILLVNKI